MTLQQAYEYLYYDLLTNRLEVKKAAGTNVERFETNGCGIRAVINKNPDWYSELCRINPRNRSSKRKNIRTIIKRKNVLEILDRLRKGNHSRSKYVPYLKDVAEQLMNSSISEEHLQFFIEFGELPKPFTDQF